MISYFEQAEDLARCIGALRHQGHPSTQLEIIVVDDGSSDAPVVPADVKLFRQEDRGFRLSAARNLGARSADGDVLCFLDADCVPDPDYIEQITRLPALEPDIVAVGRRRHARLDGWSTDRSIADLPPSRLLEDPRWLAEAYTASADLLRSDWRSYRYMIGAVLSCHRDLYALSRGFDESFTAYGGEDWDWAYRCWALGAVFAHVPDAVVWHNGPHAGISDDARLRANTEALRLAREIPVTGSRGTSLIYARPEVEIWIDHDTSIAPTVISVDSLLGTFPSSIVHLETEMQDVRDDPRIVIEADPVGAPFAVRAFAPVKILDVDRCRELVRSVGVDQQGSTTLVDAEGALLELGSRRVDAARSRRGYEAFVDVVVDASGLARRLDPDSDLSAYFGGWDE